MTGFRLHSYFVAHWIGGEWWNIILISIVGIVRDQGEERKPSQLILHRWDDNIGAATKLLQQGEISIVPIFVVVFFNLESATFIIQFYEEFMVVLFLEKRMEG